MSAYEGGAINLPEKVPEEDVDLFLKECRLAGWRVQGYKNTVLVGEVEKVKHLIADPSRNLIDLAGVDVWTWKIAYKRTPDGLEKEAEDMNLDLVAETMGKWR